MLRHARPLVLVALAAAACRSGPQGDGIHASGHVEATEVRVATKVGGTLEHIGFDEGDPVTRGQLLAQLDTTDIDLALQAARAEEGQAGAQLALLVAGARKEDVAAARAEVGKVQADLDGAARDLERMEGLLAAGSGTTKARDDARTRRDMAASALTAARERLAKLEAGSRAEEIQAGRARVAAARARIAQLEQQRQDATVNSPVEGVVTEKLAEQGELLTPGAGIAVVTRLSDPWLTVYVAEPDLDRVQVGQEADVVTDGGAHRTGKVTFVSAQAEFTPKNVQTRDERVKLVYKLKIGLPNEDGLFKPGMPAEARLDVAGATQ